MLRRYVSAAVVLLVVGGFVLADTVRGLITSASDTEVKITPLKKGEKGEAKTFKVSKDTKVLRRKGKGKDAETEDATLDDLKNAIEKSKGKRKGVRGSVETDGDKATKITFGGGRGKGKTRPKDKEGDK